MPADLTPRVWAVSVGPALVARAQGQVWREVAIGRTAAKPLELAHRVCVWEGLVTLRGRHPKVGMWPLSVPAVWGWKEPRREFRAVEARQRPSRETRETGQ